MSSIDEMHIAGLFKLVTMFCDYPSMKKIFQTPQNIELLFLKTQGNDGITSPLILDSLWESIVHIFDVETMDLYLPLIPIARNHIDAIVDRFLAFHSWCFEFLAKMTACEKAQPFFKSISQNMIRVFRTFTEHTIALSSVSSLAVKLSNIDEIGVKEIAEILPIISEIFMKNENIITNVWAFSLLKTIREKKNNSSPLIDQLPSEIVEKLNEKIALIEKPYGGKLPKEETFDSSPDQILYFLRVFMRR